MVKRGTTLVLQTAAAAAAFNVLCKKYKIISMIDSKTVFLRRRRLRSLSTTSWSTTIVIAMHARHSFGSRAFRRLVDWTTQTVITSRAQLLSSLTSPYAWNTRCALRYAIQYAVRYWDCCIRYTLDWTCIAFSWPEAVKAAADDILRIQRLSGRLSLSLQLLMQKLSFYFLSFKRLRIHTQLTHENGYDFNLNWKKRLTFFFFFFLCDSLNWSDSTLLGGRGSFSIRCRLLTFQSNPRSFSYFIIIILKKVVC